MTYQKQSHHGVLFFTTVDNSTNRDFPLHTAETHPEFAYEQYESFKHPHTPSIDGYNEGVIHW